MRTLVDQGTPVPLRKFLSGHLVRTAYQEGWSTLLNGDLLRVAEQTGFELLLTADQNLAYQQNLASRKMAIVALGSNRWSLLRPEIERIVDAVEHAKPGSYKLVEIPQKAESKTRS